MAESLSPHPHQVNEPDTSPDRPHFSDIHSPSSGDEWINAAILGALIGMAAGMFIGSTIGINYGHISGGLGGAFWGTLAGAPLFVMIHFLFSRK